MVKTANEIYRDFETDGVPSSGAHKPIKSDIREWGTAVETFETDTTSWQTAHQWELTTFHGNGTTDDTSNFTTLETTVSSRIIDLRWKTYLVTAIPTGNVYINGWFKIGSTVYDAWQTRGILGSTYDTGGIGTGYIGGLYDTPSPAGRSTNELYALVASQQSRSRGPARAVNVGSIYSEARGNVSGNFAARQCNAWVPQSVNIASEECSVWGGFRGANLAAFHSKCENESNANISTRECSASSRNGVNIATSGGYVGRGGGWRGNVTVSGGAVTAVTTATDGSTLQSGRNYQVGDSIIVLDRMSGANTAVVTVATIDSSGGIMTTTVSNGGTNYGTTAAPDGNYYIDAYVDNGTGDFSANIACGGYTDATGSQSVNLAAGGSSSVWSTASGVFSLNAASRYSVASNTETANIATDTCTASAAISGNFASNNSTVGGTLSANIAASGNSVTGAGSLSSGVLNTVSGDRAVGFGRRGLNATTGAFTISEASSGSTLSANRKFQVTSAGVVTAAGTITGSTTFTDYAEVFENLTTGILPFGTIIALDGDKVRVAKEGDDILGVVSGTAIVVAGDSPFTWSGRYLTGEFGEPLYEDVENVRWSATEDRKGYDGSLAEATKLFGTIPDDAIHSVLKERKENPDFDPTQENIPRSERPEEWTIVGLLGQINTRVSENVKPGNYVSATGDVSTVNTGLRCMRIKTAYDATKGYAVALCLKS